MIRASNQCTNFRTRPIFRQSPGYAIHGGCHLVAAGKGTSFPAHEAFMKAIDKSRFKPFLSPESKMKSLAYAAGPPRRRKKGGRRQCC